MLFSVEIGFWVIKIVVSLLLFFFLIIYTIIGLRRKNQLVIIILRIVSCLLVLTFAINLLFFKGTKTMPLTNFSKEAENFGYIENQIELYGSYENGYNEHFIESNNKSVALYKFDNLMSFNDFYLYPYLQNWDFQEKIFYNDVSYSYSNLIVCREPSYLNAYTGWYEGWLLLEKNGTIIAINYVFKADFKWYDYIVIINEPEISDKFILKMISNK